MTKIEIYSYASSFSKVVGVSEEKVLDHIESWGASSLVENAYPILENTEQVKKYECFKNMMSLTGEIKRERTPLTSPEAARDYMATLVGSEWQKERFIIVFLNSKLEPVGHDIASVGTLNQSLVHPREVFKKAIVHSAANIMVGHNHPSGSCVPSKEDNGVTKRLKEVGEIVGIPVVDHIIFEELGKDIYSYRQRSSMLEERRTQYEETTRTQKDSSFELNME